MKLQAISRINAFDLLRGWCLVVITSDHLMRFPSLFDPFTGRGLLWVTAAEGFFFISGALVGIVRGKTMHKTGLAAATKELWKRAGQLYLASIILTLIFTALTFMLNGYGLDNVKGGVNYFGSFWELLWKTATLQYSYGWTDFLNYYVVFLLLSPLALWLCRQKLWWVVMAVSLGLWVAKLGVTDIVHLSYLTWQPYFFLGLIFGYHYGDIHAWYRRLSETTRQRGWVAAVSLTVMTLLASFAFTFGTPTFENVHQGLFEFFRNVKDNQVFTLLFQENRTGLLRLAVFLLCFGTLFMLVRRYEDKIIKWVGWLLLPLGKNSLYVYIMQGAVVFLVHLLDLPQELFLNTLINVAVIMVLWYAVRQRWLFSIIPR